MMLNPKSECYQLNPKYKVLNGKNINIGKTFNLNSNIMSEQESKFVVLGF